MLVLSDGVEHGFDDLFWCTGAAPAPWIAASGLQTDEGGFIAIRDTLQVLDYDTVFAAGDVAAQCNHPRPKAGVYAVRQGPVLARNLRNSLFARPLRNHRPQQRFLSLISLGGKNATADRSIFSATGGWVWRWKDRIDREFMTRFEELPVIMPTESGGHQPGQREQEQQMPCGGCGAKVGADSLGKVLAELAGEFPEHCPNGGQTDDTAGIPGSAGLDIVQSIDVLREMVADPWLMGRLAANHALSDLFASGAKPLSALATITLPFSSPTIQERELKQLLAGALHEFAAVDCKLQGGHTFQGLELNIGFVVNGSPISTERGLLAKRGLNPGDHLVLTKPLGTGALFASHMQLKADGRHIQAAVETMLQSNAGAGKLAVEHGASACTDVTGFGMLGHLLEMLTADQGAKLSLAEIPLLAGARQCIRDGVFSTMHEANGAAKKAIGQLAPGSDAESLELLLDPQTSGGLLIGIAPDKSPALCRELKLAGYEYTVVIGVVTPRDFSLAGPLLLQ
jgi:selenide,water dikinase